MPFIFHMNPLLTLIRYSAKSKFNFQGFLIDLFH